MLREPLQAAHDPQGALPLSQAPSSAGMTRSAHKAHGRNGHAGRKELFRAEDLWLQWREMRKAVSGGGGDDACARSGCTRLIKRRACSRAKERCRSTRWLSAEPRGAEPRAQAWSQRCACWFPAPLPTRLSSSPPRVPQGAGLQNLGNTCFMVRAAELVVAAAGRACCVRFWASIPLEPPPPLVASQNSVLQSLVHTPPLAELLLSAGSGRLHNGAVNGFYPIQVATELVSRSLAHSTRSPLAPSQFAKSLRRISRRCGGLVGRRGGAGWPGRVQGYGRACVWQAGRQAARRPPACALPACIRARACFVRARTVVKAGDDPNLW